LTSQSVRSRNQGVCVVGWAGVWEWGVGMWCMVGLLGGGCGGMERGCVCVGLPSSSEVVCVLDSPAVVGSSGGVVGFSIEKWGWSRVVWWMSYEIGLFSTRNREVGWYRDCECWCWSRLLQFEKGLVWVKPNSCEEGTSALKVARCPPWGWRTQARRKVGWGIDSWGGVPKQNSKLRHDSRQGSAGTVTCWEKGDWIVSLGGAPGFFCVLVCYAATQLATQLQQRCIQFVFLLVQVVCILFLILKCLLRSNLSKRSKKH